MRDIRILLVEDNQPGVDLLEEYLALATGASYPITHVDFTQFFDVVKSIESYWLTVVKLPAASSSSEDLYKEKGAALTYRDTRLSQAQVCARPARLT